MERLKCGECGKQAGVLMVADNKDKLCYACYKNTDKVSAVRIIVGEGVFAR